MTRRPHATRRRSELREIGAALLVWFLILLALFYALPVLLVAAS